MLSILIPTYNYNIYPLAKELHQQCFDENIAFEILCQDDCSNSDLNTENQKINELTYATFKVSDKNLGRGKNINTLASEAKHNYILIMEADSFPASKKYISTIVSNMSQNTEAVFGGVLYPEKPKDDKKILRWKYGNFREIKPLQHRLKNVYDFTFSWNLVIKKSILNEIKFIDKIQVYGYDDLLFRKKLKEKKIKVLHIENPLIHINEENSSVFLEKSKKASEDAYKMVELNIIEASEIKLTNAHLILKKVNLDKLYAGLFSILKPQMEKNLLSKNPSLFILDLYKLGFICKI